MKPEIKLIDPDEVMYETRPESTLVQMLWLAPGIVLLAYIIGHLVLSII